MSAPLIVVDERNVPIGEATREDVHARALWHRAIHCLVQDRRRHVFLALRDDVVCGDRFDVSLTEHVRPGESFVDATRRGLARRLGIPAVDVEAVTGVFADRDVHDGGPEHDGRSLADYRFMQIFRARHDGAVALDRRVYQGGIWLAPDEVDELVAAVPRRFAPHFLKDWVRVRAAVGTRP